MDAKRLAEALKNLDAQSFRPGDSLLASTINHPIDAVGQLGNWIAERTNTAAGIPEQYDNPNPLLAPQGQEQAAFDLAGMAQLGSMPFAPKSAGGTLGTVTGFSGAEGIGKVLDDKYGNVLDAWISGDKQGLKLDKLIVDKDKRGGGIGSAFLDDLTNYADEQGQKIRLMADGDFGGSKARQKKFYKNAGFVENKGRNKDYSFSENMFRNPEELQPLQSDNLNSSLLAKYLREGQLSPQELAQYETNAVQMTDNGKHHYNLANANAQGGTPESRAGDLGFDVEAYRGQNTQIPESLAIKEYPWKNDYKEVFSTDSPEIASSYALRDGSTSDGYVMPLLLKKENEAVLDWNGDKFTSNRSLFREYSSAKDNGHDFVDVKNIRDNFDSGAYTEPHSNFISFKPQNIRSRFAAFDPLRKDSANLLASYLLPATMLGFGMAPQDDRQSLIEALRNGN